ncbi:MAG: glycosyltransferase family 39 protein [Bryobacteraceae bacterium]
MKTRLAIPVLTAAFLVLLYAFLAAKLSPGMQSEGTDWAMYVTHARNIVKGLPYAQTGYVFQPESTTEVGAKSYPSGYPFLLAPFYAVFGLNIRLFKLLNLAFLVLSLWPIYLYARRTLPPVHSLLLIVAFGFSALFLADFDAFGSDAPYQLASFLVLLLLLRICDRRLNETNPWKWGLLAGFSIAGAYLIRPIGLAFLLAAAGAELLRKRRPIRFLVAIATAFIPPMLLNNFLLHKDSSYAYQFTASLLHIARHAVAYAGFLSYVFANPLSHYFRYLLWAVTLVLALFAVSKRVRAGLGVTELYLLAVLAVVSVYWVPNARYLLCVMPIYMVYMFEGFRMLAARVPQRFARPLQVAAAALLLFAPAANAVLVRPDASDTLVTAPKYEALCAAIRRQAAPHALVIFWNPRVLALSTGRFSSGWPAEGPPERMIQYLRRVLPDYIVADKSRPDDRRFLIPVLAAGPLRRATVYENDQFTLMQLLETRSGKDPE